MVVIVNSKKIKAFKLAGMKYFNEWIINCLNLVVVDKKKKQKTIITEPEKK